MFDDIRIQMAFDDLKSDDPDTRIAAIETLGQGKQKEAVPNLAAALVDDHEAVRQAALIALGQMGGLAVLPSLFNLLRHDDLADREAVIQLGEDTIERFAREVHDGLAAQLAAASMQVAVIERLIERDPSRIPDEVASLKQVTSTASRQVRDIINNLRAVHPPSDPA